MGPGRLEGTRDGREGAQLVSGISWLLFGGVDEVGEW